MKNPASRPFLATLALLAALPALTLPAATPVTTETYQIDPAHTNVGFRVRHLMSKVTGRFGKVSGTVSLDPKDLTRSTVDVTIDVASVSTNDDKRDGHLKSPDFFDAAKYPTITFKSTAVRQVAKDKLEVTGVFSMHGVTKTLVIPVVSLGTATDPWKNVIAGFEGALKLNRQEFGVSYGPGLVGDEVEIDLNVEAKKL